MGSLFSRKKDAGKGSAATSSGNQKPVLEVDRAVLQLKMMRDKLTQYQRRMEDTLAFEKESASRMLQEGHRDRAILLLKRRKFQQKLLQDSLFKLENLSTMVSTLEQTHMDAEVLRCMEDGTTTLKHLQSQLGLDRAQEIMSNAMDAIALEEEISTVLGQSASSLFSEAELDAELAALTQAVEVEPSVVSGPSVNPRLEELRIPQEAPVAEPPPPVEEQPSLAPAT